MWFIKGISSLIRNVEQRGKHILYISLKMLLVALLCMPARCWSNQMRWCSLFMVKPKQAEENNQLVTP